MSLSQLRLKSDNSGKKSHHLIQHEKERRAKKLVLTPHYKNNDLVRCAFCATELREMESAAVCSSLSEECVCVDSRLLTCATRANTSVADIVLTFIIIIIIIIIITTTITIIIS
jgi:hypothetical protein